MLFDKSQSTLLGYPGGLGGSYAVPGSVTSIGQAAFLGAALTSVTIPGSVTSIPYEAFFLCTSLTNVTIANGVTSIGYYAFAFCYGLTSVSIPDSVTSIGQAAFQECFSLGSVIIPGSVTNIGGVAFAFCYRLTSVYFKGNAPSADATVFGVANPTVYYLSDTTGWGVFSANTGLTPVLWNPLIQASSANFGVQNNQFGFTITNGSTNNIPILVEACANLASPVWTPLTNVTLTNGSFYFSDPQWTNYPARFYRISSP